MNFDQSGLPANQLVQDAFNHSYKYLMATTPDLMKSFERQISRMYRDERIMLERSKKNMSEQEYQETLKELEEGLKEQLKAGPGIIKRQLDREFANSKVRPAQELFRHADKASPEALAAVMLVECIRSPRDFKAIEDNFGPVVATMVSDLIHIEVYASERAKTLDGVSQDVKRAYLASSIAELATVGERAVAFAKQNPGQRMIFPDGHEQTMFDSAKKIWGIDAKLDARLIEVFNKTAEVVLSKFRFEKDADGDLALVPFTPPTPPKQISGPKKPPTPPGPGNIGGDVF